jgi:hypothetical protein
MKQWRVLYFVANTCLLFGCEISTRNCDYNEARADMYLGGQLNHIRSEPQCFYFFDPKFNRSTGFEHKTNDVLSPTDLKFIDEVRAGTACAMLTNSTAGEATAMEQADLMERHMGAARDCCHCQVNFTDCNSPFFTMRNFTFDITVLVGDQQSTDVMCSLKQPIGAHAIVLSGDNSKLALPTPNAEPLGVPASIFGRMGTSVPCTSPIRVTSAHDFSMTFSLAPSVQGVIKVVSAAAMERHQRRLSPSDSTFRRLSTTKFGQCY